MGSVKLESATGGCTLLLSVSGGVSQPSPVVTKNLNLVLVVGIQGSSFAAYRVDVSAAISKNP